MKVVVVEQDVAMRTLMAEWLSADGHEVRTLGSPDGARGIDAGIDLAIVDLVDLRGSGVTHVCDLQRHFPRATTIGISTELGRSLGPHSELTRALQLRHLLAKPCSRDELLHAVGASLPRPRVAAPR